MKKVLSYIFGKWDSFDYTTLALTIIVSSIICSTMGYSALSAVVAVFLVLGTILVSKNTTLGYATEIVAMGLFCAVLKADNLSGNLLVCAVVVMPLMVYKIVSLYVAKLNEPIQTKKWEYVALAGVLGACAYPVYLLMISMNSFMAAVGVVSILIAFTMAFFEVRAYNWAKYIYIIITTLQGVLYGMIMYFDDTREINILIGLAMSLLLQIYYCSKELSAVARKRKASRLGTTQTFSTTK